ncbi:Isochorismatase domain-containing protein 1 [Blyttiomyces sp. JEL0837]|nr:Isochorismatase domain-containing protein 1 [Blyttiomyces sp. JEL0837]
MSTSATTVSRSLRPSPESTAFFLCDIQSKFVPHIWNWSNMVDTAGKMVAASKLLNIPLIVTEQNPKGLGHTVPELDISHARTILPKTKFSMWIPEVENDIKNNLKTKHVVLFGIERMRDAGATITTSECVLFQLLGDAKNDAFKPVQGLVKEQHHYGDWIDPELADHIGLGDESDGTAAAKASIDIPISNHNMGYKLIMKLGWTQGTGLGKRGGEGRVDPIPFITKQDLYGVGKLNQLNDAHVDSTSKRKLLDSEVMANETEEQRVKREAKVQKTEQIKEEIKAVTAAFYCELCDKQYSKISEYETHLSSYDHNHKKRFKDMQEMSKRGSLPGTSGKKNIRDKEREREEREMKKLQEAALARELRNKGSTGGIGTMVSTSTLATATASQSLVSSSGGGGGGGFKPIGGSASSSGGGFKPIEPSWSTTTVGSDGNSKGSNNNNQGFSKWSSPLTTTPTSSTTTGSISTSTGGGGGFGGFKPMESNTTSTTTIAAAGGTSISGGDNGNGNNNPNNSINKGKISFGFGAGVKSGN